MSSVREAWQRCEEPCSVRRREEPSYDYGSIGLRIKVQKGFMGETITRLEKMVRRLLDLRC